MKMINTILQLHVHSYLIVKRITKKNQFLMIIYHVNIDSIDLFSWLSSTTKYLQNEKKSQTYGISYTRTCISTHTCLYPLPFAKREGSEGGGGMAELSFSLEGGGRLGGFILINPSLLGASPSPLFIPLLLLLLSSFKGGGRPLPPTPPTAGSLDELTTGRGPSENFLEGGGGGGGIAS